MIDNHGGNIYDFAKKNGIYEEDIIDFSSNVNWIIDMNNAFNIIENSIMKIRNYPDINYTLAKARLANYFNVERNQIVLGNGSAELIFLLSQILKNKNVLIIEPNFSEYQKAAKCLKLNVDQIVGRENNNFKPTNEEIIFSTVENSSVFLSSPNNPVGYTFSITEIEELLNSFKTKKSTLILDLAFADFDSEVDYAEINALINEYDNLFILRSLTKSLSIAGIRLGILLSNEKNIEKIKTKTPPWNVNIFAAEIAENISVFKGETISSLKKISSLKEEFFNRLSEINSLKIFKSNANYFLIKILTGSNVFDLQNYLTDKKILIRNCSNYEGLSDKYFRCAIRSSEENMQLITLLKEFFGE